jgi:hypothetical protein
MFSKGLGFEASSCTTRENDRLIDPEAKGLNEPSSENEESRPPSERHMDEELRGAGGAWDLTGFSFPSQMSVNAPTHMRIDSFGITGRKYPNTNSQIESKRKCAPRVS